MDHQTIKEQLFALYDGELDAAARKEIESHLGGCTECREIYERWTKTAKAFFKAPTVHPSEFFVRQVMGRIQGSEVPRRVPTWNITLRWLVPVIGVAAMFFVVMRPAPNLFSMDALLLGSQDMGASLLYEKAPTVDETLEFVMEESI